MPAPVSPGVPPTPPTSADPTNFATRADAFLTWLAGVFYGYLVAVVAYIGEALGLVDVATAAASAAVNASTLTATSGASLSMGTGVKVITGMEAGRTFPLNSRVTMMRRSAPATRMRGYVSTAVSGTGMSVTIDDSPGAIGPYTDWFIIASAFEPVATAALALKANPTLTTPLAKGNSGTTTQVFDVAAAAVQTLTNTGIHAWNIIWPSGHSELAVLVTNPGAFAITLPAGVLWERGDGTYSTTFSTMGIVLQAAAKNWIFLWSPDGGATVYGRAL